MMKVLPIDDIKVLGDHHSSLESKSDKRTLSPLLATMPSL